MLRIIIFGFSLFFISLVKAETSIIIAQPGSPLEIKTYVASYQPELGRYQREGVKHEVVLKNVSEQNVNAYRVTFQSFDAFNEHMGRGLGGISIETINSESDSSGTWVQSPYAVFTFEKYGTGVAYVSSVRLADGSVWKANQEFILKEMKKISSDLTSSIFEDDNK
jgi:hypothetical protein